jgi:hypothetical protein
MDSRAWALVVYLTGGSVMWAQSPAPSVAGPERTVRDVHSQLARGPGELIDKTVLLQALVLEQLQVRTMNPAVTRCSNFLILIDPESCQCSRSMERSDRL